MSVFEVFARSVRIRTARATTHRRGVGVSRALALREAVASDRAAGFGGALRNDRSSEGVLEMRKPAAEQPQAFEICRLASTAADLEAKTDEQLTTKRNSRNSSL